ncbi:MAG: sulfite exporter TauE/SafE family protein [Thermoplasmata archaeon]|nr:sulfite exporter TauE/SafE family protein [Thermoplasmata archaeon]
MFLGSIMLLIFLAFIFEYTDSSLGMGYGTSLTPVLLIMGFGLLQIVPALLLSEFMTGLLAGTFHHYFGNVNLRSGSIDLKVMVILSVCSIIGVVISVFAFVSLPGDYIKLYIGIMVLSIGVVILLTFGRTFVLTMKKIVGLGLFAAFNKGISGGGYGPVATGGQILSGVHSKSAIGICSVAEGLTSAVGAVLFLLFVPNAQWGLVPWLLIGGLISVPIAAFTVKKVHARNLRVMVGIAISVLGILTLAKVAFGWAG